MMMMVMMLDDGDDVDDDGDDVNDDDIDVGDEDVDGDDFDDVDDDGDVDVDVDNGYDVVNDDDDDDGGGDDVDVADDDDDDDVALRSLCFVFPGLQLTIVSQKHGAIHVLHVHRGACSCASSWCAWTLGKMAVLL